MRILRSLGLLLLALPLFACAPFADGTAEHAVPAMTYFLSASLYYPDTDGSVTRVERTFPWEYEMEKGVLDALKEAPRDGLLPALPLGVSYRILLRGADATVDILDLPAFTDEATERACIACVVDTLLSLAHVDSVQLLFNGERVSALKYGTKVYDPFTAQLP